MPNLVVFSGNAHPQFAHKVVSHLHIPLGSAQVANFSDGEISIDNVALSFNQIYQICTDLFPASRINHSNMDSIMNAFKK